MEFDKLSTDQLVGLIRAAAEELARRTLIAPIVETAAPPPLIPSDMLAPSAEDREFVKSCLNLSMNGSYVVAADKSRYAEVAEKFPDWFAAKKYPTSIRGRNVTDWARHRSGRPA